MSDQTAPTLYSLTADDVLTALRGSDKDAHKDLLTALERHDTPEEQLEFLRADRDRLRLTLEIGRFRKFSFLELKADDAFNWTLKLQFDETMSKIHHVYKLHLCHNPKPYFDRIKEIDTEIIKIRGDLALIPDENDAKIVRLEERRAAQENLLAEAEAVCADITFTATVRESKYKDGTVVTFVIEPHVASALNDQRHHIKDYHVRLQTL